MLTKLVFEFKKRMMKLNCKNLNCIPWSLFFWLQTIHPTEVHAKKLRENQTLFLVSKSKMNEVCNVDIDLKQLVLH